MGEAASKLPVKTDEKSARRSADILRPFESLRHEIDRLFDDVSHGFFRTPGRRSLFGDDPLFGRGVALLETPAVDIAEKEKGYEITAELPGMGEGDVEVNLANGVLTIKGEKKEEKEEKRKDYYLSERRYGSFQRAFRVPEGVDEGKIEASFKKGVLTVSLPKTSEAQRSATKIAIKAS